MRTDILRALAAPGPRPAWRRASGLRASDVFAPIRRRGKPERALQKAVALYLRARGCLVAITDAGAAYRAGAFFGDAIPAGWPDITGLLPDGRFIGVECKVPGGRQSPAQVNMEQEIRRRKGIYVLAYRVEDVEQLFLPDNGHGYDTTR